MPYAVFRSNGQVQSYEVYRGSLPSVRTWLHQELKRVRAWGKS